MVDISQLVAGLEDFVRHYGAFAVMLILAIEAIGAPVPGESLLIFASVLASRGEMSLPALLIFAWVGSVIGDNLGFLIGRKLGRKTVLRYGAKVGLTNERFSKIENTYVRYGSATVFANGNWPGTAPPRTAMMLHSITSSAREIRACGTSIPSALAAF